MTKGEDGANFRRLALAWRGAAVLVGLAGCSGDQMAPAAAPAKVPAAVPAEADDAALDGREGRPLALDQFQPRSMLRVEEHFLSRAKFPVVDVHVHPRVRLRHSGALLDDFVSLMDQHQVAVCASLDGEMGDLLREHMGYLGGKYADRFVVFCSLDWRGQGEAQKSETWDFHRPDFARRMVEELKSCQAIGVSGLKVFKELGLKLRNPDGTFVRVDDPRWDPIWAACGELGLPVLIHTADPRAFFEPVDRTNERWEELRRHPDWSYDQPETPKYQELIAQFLAVVERHPRTVFIGAHVASSAEDLAAVGEWLDKHPNLYVDIAARIGELGRQPFTSRRFFLRYADRILFGTDGPRVHERLAAHWRCLETEDEYFPYAENPFPPQGFWRIYGLNLPDEVLKKIYYENAARIIPGVRERLDAFVARQKQAARRIGRARRPGGRSVAAPGAEPGMTLVPL